MTDTKRHPAVLALATAAALALTLGGCSKPAPKTETTTTTASMTTTTASTGGAAGLPSECQAYFDKVGACMNKLGASNPAAAQFKVSMDQARTQWAGIQDKAALTNVCKQASASFAQSSAAMGC